MSREPLLHSSIPSCSFSSTLPNQPPTWDSGLGRQKIDKIDGVRNDSEHSNSLIGQLAAEETDLYERKCILVNREIDAMGMGKYQWCIWTLCGLGYMIDLMWAQAYGLVLSPMQQELGFGDDQTGNLSTAFSLGLTAGTSSSDMADNFYEAHGT